MFIATSCRLLLLLLKLGQKPEAQMAFQKAAALDPKIAEQLKQQGLYS